MLDHGPHPPRSREKKRNPWRQYVHRATRPRSYAIDKVWEAVTSRCLGNSRSDTRCKQYGGVKSIICYLCFMQHAWSCYFWAGLHRTFDLSFLHLLRMHIWTTVSSSLMCWMSSLWSSRTEGAGDFHDTHRPQSPPAITDGGLLQSRSRVRGRLIGATGTVRSNIIKPH